MPSSGESLNGGYAIACGMEIADLVENFVFEDDDIEYLASIQAPGGGPMFKDGFLEYLRNHRLDLTIHAIPEGDVVFPREPMVASWGRSSTVSSSRRPCSTS